MAQRNFQIVKSIPSSDTQMKDIRAELKKSLKKSQIEHVKRRRDVVRDWSNSSRPRFTGKVVEESNGQVAIQISASGTKKQLRIWDMVDKTGARPHTIRSRSGVPLAFPWGGPGSYRPHTTPGNPPKHGGPGAVSGGVPTFLRVVRNPGFPPRNFSVAINKEIESDTLEAIEDGISEGFE